MVLFDFMVRELELGCINDDLYMDANRLAGTLSLTVVGIGRRQFVHYLNWDEEKC